MDFVYCPAAGEVQGYPYGECCSPGQVDVDTLLEALRTVEGELPAFDQHIPCVDIKGICRRLLLERSDPVHKKNALVRWIDRDFVGDEVQC